MGKLDPTWISQVPYQNMTEEKFKDLSASDMSFYARGYELPHNKSIPAKTYVAYVDGGCFDNGSIKATAYGSFKVYDVTNLLYKGIMPSHVHQMVQDARFVPCYENARFPIALGNTKKATNNYAEACSMQMVLLEGINQGFISPNNHMFIFSDSELIINHLKGVYSVKNAHLASVYKDIHKMLQGYQNRHKTTPWYDFNIEKIPGTLMKKILGH